MEILQGVWAVIKSILINSGYAYFFTADGGWKNLVILLMARYQKGLRAFAYDTYCIRYATGKFARCKPGSSISRPTGIL